MLRFGLLPANRVIIYNLATSMSKVVTFEVEELLICLSVPEGFLCADNEKHLKIFKVDEQSLEHNLVGEIYMPKKITHGVVEEEKLYFCDKHGDISSVPLQSVRESKKSDEADILLESGNFCMMTCVRAISNKSGERLFVTGDEYYKIRLFSFPNLHDLRTSISFKKRFVRSLQFWEDDLLVGFDDGSVFRLSKDQLDRSDSIGENELTHLFSGSFSFIGTFDSIVVSENETGRLLKCSIEGTQIKIDKEILPGGAKTLISLGDNDIVQLQQHDSKILEFCKF